MTTSLLPAAQPAAPSREIPGLNGLRALSVVAVMLYHAQLPGMHGGYLGVEVFFVISGFLITRLLLNEWQRKGRIELGAFMARRARRLLPALLLLLLAVALVGAFRLGPRAAQYRWDLLASLAYLENWYQIQSGNSYFAEHGLPLLRHLWSLAVEGQFYLVWPLLVAALLSVPRAGRKVLAVTVALLALGSFLLMLHLADPGNPSSVKAAATLNRAYLGTDTRAFGLMVGALLAMAPLAAWVTRVAGWVLDACALLALAGLGLLCWLLAADNPWLYRGGLVLVDLLTVVLIAAFTRPQAGVVARGLGWGPLEWAGKVSYGLYLWHWPLYKLMGHGPGGRWWLLVPLTLTVLITAASYHLVEQPIQQGALKRWRGNLRARPWRRAVALAAGVLLMAVSIRAGVVMAHQPAYVDEIQESLKANARALDSSARTRGPAALTAADLAPALPRTPLVPGLPVPLPAIPLEALEDVSITAIGDSVMKGAALALVALGEEDLGDETLVVNAEESRSFALAYQVARDYKAADRLGEVVVIHLGTNNSGLSKAHFTRLMDLLADRRLVLFLTAKSDKGDACDQVNGALAQWVKAYPNARLFDWRAAAEGHPELFYSDQTHLRPAGARFYAASIFAQVGRYLGQEPEPAP